MEHGYDYESTYAVMMEGIEQEFLQISVVDVLGNKNLKKTPNPIWKNNFVQTSYCLFKSRVMNISSFAQETMCYTGQHLVFKEAEDLISN